MHESVKQPNAYHVEGGQQRAYHSLNLEYVDLDLYKCQLEIVIHSFIHSSVQLGVLGIKPRALHMLGECCTAELGWGCLYV
jgi:hypothetical protein